MEFAIEGGSPERATLRTGKGKPMKALLKKKWGANYAGQVLTNVEKGSIPADVAEFYEDNEPSPMDVVKDESGTDGDPLVVVNDALDPKKAQAVGDDKRRLVEAAKDAGSPQAGADAAAQAESEATQRRAREADDFAAGQIKKAGKGGGLSKEQLESAEAGKGHGPKVKKTAKK